MKDIQRKAPSASRLQLIDGVRGYLLSAMFLAHVGIEMRELGSRSILRLARHDRYLPVGDVDFFLFLSGFVTALAYLPSFTNGGIAGTGKAVLRRIRWLYLYQVGATMLLILLVRLAGLQGVDLRAGDETTSTWILLLQAMTFAVMPENLDILMLYIVMMPFMPWVLKWLGEKRFWQLFAVLIALWTIAHLGLDVRVQAWLIGHGFDWRPYFSLMGHFNPLSYALLFYTGFAIGHAWSKEGPAVMTRIAPPRLALVAAAMAIVLIYAVGTRLLQRPPFWVQAPSELLTIHTALNTVAVLYLFYWLLGTPHEKPAVIWLQKLVTGFFTLRFFVFLGRNGLFAYAIHVVIVAILKHLVMTGELETSHGAILALTATGLATIGVLTMLKRRWLPLAA